MLASYDPSLINAVIVLTDGMNDDGDPGRRPQAARGAAGRRSSRNSDGENAKPVRIFTIAYGSGTDPTELRRIAEASNATAYQASDANDHQRGVRRRRQQLLAACAPSRDTARSRVRGTGRDLQACGGHVLVP